MALNVEKAEQQIYDLRKTVRYDIRELTIEIMVNKYVKGIGYSPDLLINARQEYYGSLWIPDYQRDFTWDFDRQSCFIESILLGLPIPLVFVAENKDGVFEVVDGSQRIRTLNAFLDNKLRLNNLEKLTLLNGFYFKDLELTRQEKLKNIPLRMIVLTEETTEEVKKDMFERINRGSDLLKPMEKRKGIYKGIFNDFIYQQCAKNELFIKLAPIDKWLINRQEREELILRYFALIEKYDKFPSNSGITKVLDEFIDKENKRLAILSKEEVQKELNLRYEDFKRMLLFVKDYAPMGFRIRQNPQTKRTVFEAISVGVHLALKENNRVQISKEKMRAILLGEDFFNITLDHVANKWAYSPDRVKGRIEYVKKSILEA